MSEHNSRHLHFIVRSDKSDYRYNPGYGYFLNHVLEQLNASRPKDANTLLESAASLIFAPAQPVQASFWEQTEIPKRDPMKLKNSLPARLAATVDESRIIPREPINPAFGGKPDPMFGPVCDPEYGFPTSAIIAISNNSGQDFGAVTLEFQVRKLLQHVASDALDDTAKAAACKLIGQKLGIALDVQELPEATDRVMAAIEKVYQNAADDCESGRRKRATRWEDKWSSFYYDITRAQIAEQEGGNPLATYTMPNAVVHGDALITPVRTVDFEGRFQAYRGYLEALCKNQNLKPDAIPEDLRIAFDYPIPGNEETLPLMRIGTRKALKEDFVSRFTSEHPELLSDVKAANFAREYYFENRDEFTEPHEEPMIGKKRAYSPVLAEEVVMIHPQCDKEFIGKLARCIDPLLHKIDAPDNGLDDKLDAAFEAYWLVAQSTPIWRGGSAYARVILEHLSDRIREQGYDYSVPYTRENVDLWAEAATSDLASFKARMRSSELFDDKCTDAQMEDFALAHIHPALKSGSSAGGWLARAGGA